MNMRDTETGRVLWKANNWTAEDMFHNEIKGTHEDKFFLVKTFLYSYNMVTPIFIMHRGNT